MDFEALQSKNVYLYSTFNYSQPYANLFYTESIRDKIYLRLNFTSNCLIKVFPIKHFSNNNKIHKTFDLSRLAFKRFQNSLIDFPGFGNLPVDLIVLVLEHSISGISGFPLFYVEVSDLLLKSMILLISKNVFQINSDTYFGCFSCHKGDQLESIYNKSANYGFIAANVATFQMIKTKVVFKTFEEITVKADKFVTKINNFGFISVLHRKLKAFDITKCRETLTRPINDSILSEKECAIVILFKRRNCTSSFCANLVNGVVRFRSMG